MAEITAPLVRRPPGGRSKAILAVHRYGLIPAGRGYCSRRYRERTSRRGFCGGVFFDGLSKNRGAVLEVAAFGGKARAIGSRRRRKLRRRRKNGGRERFHWLILNFGSLPSQAALQRRAAGPDLVFRISIEQERSRHELRACSWSRETLTSPRWKNRLLMVIRGVSYCPTSLVDIRSSVGARPIEVKGEAGLN